MPVLALKTCIEVRAALRTMVLGPGEVPCMGASHPFCLPQHLLMGRQRKCCIDLDNNAPEELKPLSKLLHLETNFAPKGVFRILRGHMPRTLFTQKFSLTF